MSEVSEGLKHMLKSKRSKDRIANVGMQDALFISLFCRSSLTFAQTVVIISYLEMIRNGRSDDAWLVLKQYLSSVHLDEDVSPRQTRLSNNNIQDNLKRCLLDVASDSFNKR